MINQHLTKVMFLRNKSGDTFTIVTITFLGTRIAGAFICPYDVNGYEAVVPVETDNPLVQKIYGIQFGTVETIQMVETEGRLSGTELKDYIKSGL